MRLLVASTHYERHGRRGGYRQLTEFLPADVMTLRRSDGASSMIYRASLLAKRTHFEARVALTGRRYDVVHVLFADNGVGLLPPARGGVAYVGTVHLPDRDQLLELGGRPGPLARSREAMFNRMGGIIAMSSSLASSLKERYPNLEVEFIPHGVRLPSNAGDPGAELGQGLFHIGIIGAVYRDTEFIYRFARLTSRSRPDWRFHLIGVPPSLRAALSEQENVFLYPRLSDNEYLRLVAGLHAHLLPLTYASANNALLEAHCLGVPSVCSDLPGISDYVVESTLTFSDSEGCLFALDGIYALSTAERAALEKRTKEDAVAFDWESVAKQTIEFYGRVLETDRAS